MRFAFIVTNLAGGGAEKALLKIGTGLMARGHEADIWALEDIVQHRLPPELGYHALSRSVGHGWLGKHFAARKLRRAIRAVPPYDLIVSTLPFADEVVCLAGLPRHWCRIANTLSVEISTLAKQNPSKAARRLARYRSCYQARPLIAVSQGVAHDLRENLGLRSRVEVVPNPFDRTSIASAAMERNPAIPSRPFVLHVGRFAAQKRHDLLLDAWAKTETDRILVLLTAAEPALESMIAERKLGDRVTIAGFQTNPYPWMAAADLLVLCSDHEGLPNVLIEALICGTPAISTDCPSGPREILGAFPQCLVPCDDADALADAIATNLRQAPDVSSADLSAYDDANIIAAYQRLAKGD